MTFDYTHVEGGDAALDGYEPFVSKVQKLTSSPPHSVDEELSDLFDVDSDGLPDILVTAPGTYGNGFAWFRNDGKGFSTEKRIRVEGRGGANAGSLTLKNPNLMPLDADGDGRVDLVHMPRVKTYAVYGFEDDGTAAKPDWVLRGRDITTAGAQSPKVDLGDAAETQLADVNVTGCRCRRARDGASDLFRARVTRGDTQFKREAHGLRRRC